MGMEAISVYNLFEINMEDRTREYRYTLCKKQTGTLKKIFLSAGVANPWNELSEETFVVDTMEKFTRKLSEFG